MQANTQEQTLRAVYGRRSDQIDAAVMSDWQWSIEDHREPGETISERDRNAMAFQGLYGDDRPGHVFP